MAEANGRVVAFLDIGANSIRLMVAQVEADHTWRVLTVQKEMARLGEGAFTKLRLQTAAMDRALLVCGRFTEMAKSMGARRVIAAATSAVREAGNRRSFMARLRHALDIEAHVISGQEEARLIYLGAASGLKLQERAAVFIDIGGGSTEVIIGNGEGHQFLDSVKVGAVRLTNKFIKDRQDAISPDLYEQMLHYARQRASGMVRQASKLPFDMAVGSSGTADCLIDQAARMHKGRASERGDLMTRQELTAVMVRLCGLTLEQRRDLPGMNAQRADIIIGGGAILQAMMEALNIESIRFSERGMLDGLLIDYLSRRNSQASQGANLRQKSVMGLGRRFGFDEAHGAQVAKLTRMLFDAAKGCGLHDLGSRERELLGHAAMLHDVGASLSYEGRHRHSYYFIRSAQLLGFDEDEIALIAVIALLYRKPTAKAKRPELAALGKNDRKAVVALSVLLRLADGLDRSHSSVVESVNLTLDKQALVMNVTSSQACDLEVWSMEAGAEVVERILGKTLHVRVDRPTAVAK